MTGVFIEGLSRCRAARVVVESGKGIFRNRSRRQIGNAIAALVDSTVTVAIRHSDKAATASEAATALVSPEEATGAGWL
ncbi:hypothetical protein [Bradyrhizobium sp.]|uniref:hypothetical protein n=1 Tax=Bradyrhizobium sp. TaxID=376 RepID=UPI00262A2D28|nr:hypothetical protein [Bradyrhizobium sp.]